MATKGSHALKLSGEFSGTTWEEMGVYIDPPDGRDWSSWDTLSVDVYAPAEASGFIAQIFMKTGDDWTWVKTPDIQLVPGEWNTLTADLSAMDNAAAVKEVSVKIGTSVTAFKDAFYIDNVTLVGTDNELIKQYTKNLRDGAEDPLDITYPEVTDAILTLEGLADGEYTVEWWNTFTGEIDHSETIIVIDGTASVAVPVFLSDWAVKVRPAE